MGMFDHLKCEYKLPIAGTQDLEYQTKSLVKFLDNYKIDKDGQLWVEKYKIEDRSDPEAEGISRIFGCMSRINQRLEKDNFTGEIRFYTHLDKDYKYWVEYSAYFTNGQLQILNVVEDGTKPLSFPEEKSIEPTEKS